MRIIHFLGFYPEIGGPVVSVGLLVKKLIDKGVECKIISSLPKGYDKKRLESYLSNPYIFYYEMNGLYKLFPSYSTELQRIIGSLVYDANIIHTHSFFDYYTYYICKNINNKKIVLSPRGSLVEWGFSNNVLSWLKKRLYLKTFGKMILDRVDAIHLTGEYEREMFHKLIGHQYDNKIFIVPNGIYLNIPLVDDSLFRGKFNIEIDKKIVLFLGRIHKVKGLDILIPAFGKLCKETDNLLLVIAGPDEKGYKAKVEKMIMENNVENNILFTGHIDGELKWSAYKSAEVFVLPSYTENFGMAALEAMISGTPVVMSKEVGLGWDIKEENIAIVVDTDVDSLLNGIKRVLTENIRDTLIKNAYKFVKNYDIDVITDKMVKLYNTLL